MCYAQGWDLWVENMVLPSDGEETYTKNQHSYHSGINSTLRLQTMSCRNRDKSDWRHVEELGKASHRIKYLSCTLKQKTEWKGQSKPSRLQRQKSMRKITVCSKDGKLHYPLPRGHFGGLQGGIFFSWPNDWGRLWAFSGQKLGRW